MIIRLPVSRSKLIVTLLGIALSLVFLELGLRFLGFCFLQRQRLHNRLAAGQDASYTVLCLGESTTALGGRNSYPRQLQAILAESGWGSFAVVNAGLPSGNSTQIVEQLPTHLDRHDPDVVVVMMGMNDGVLSATPFVTEATGGVGGVLGGLKTVRLLRQLHHDLGLENREARASAFEAGTSPNPNLGAPGMEEFFHLRSARRARALTATREPACAAWLEALAGSLETPSMAEDAVAPLVEGISSCPPEAELHLLLAIALDVGQHSDAAIAEFYRTIEMDPAQTEAYLPLATQLLLADRYQEAWDVAESGRPHIAETASLDMLQGDCARAMGKGEEALALYDRAAETPYYGPAVTQAKENLRAGGGAGHAPDVPQHASVAGTLGTPAYSDATRTNYRTLRRMLAASGVHLVVVQYPLLSTPPLEGLIDDPQVQVVDNGPSFATALEHQPYEALFTDRCYGNFGHATRAGNRILAQNVADAILDLM